MKTIKIFERIRDDVGRSLPRMRSTELDFRCPIARRDHAVSSRQYAHVFCQFHPKAYVICLDPAIDRLAAKYIFGIIFHEFGHLIAGPNSTEAQANFAIWDYLRIRIKYSRDKKKLEYIE